MDISLDKQSIDKIFSSTTYHIDFYQRHYKWTKEPVNRMWQMSFIGSTKSAFLMNMPNFLH
ncbi:hypothetical protein SAMN04515668_4556 [Hymenobacter arizonensis]|uniref:DUF262 domain-containing protein n=1 Tax=Hymenobacter arizonensis TaxID=1227077 RepID=A0A1I6BH17_HYMAR|nr:hypothetical protein SAMN04515668_4556 [Hymenobacter arizonensis]